MDRDGNNIKLKVHEAVLLKLEQDIISCKVDNTVHCEQDTLKASLLKIAPHPNTSKDYNFEEEVNQLPSQFNYAESTLNEEHPEQLLN